MLSCAIAIRLPTVMLRTASNHRTVFHSSLRESSEPVTRIRAPKAAALTATAMKPVTTVGAPW